MGEKEKRQNLKSKLYVMVRKVNALKPSNERMKAIYELDALASFMYQAAMINLKEYQDIMGKIIHNGELNYINKRRKQVFNELFIQNDKLEALYQEVKPLFSDVDMKKRDTSVKQNTLEEALNNFLQSIDVFNLWKNIKENERFYLGSKNVLNGVCIDGIDKSYIVLGKLDRNDIMYYLVLVHELGQAYANKMVQSEKINFYDGELYREIIPETFVRMFLDFLKKNKLLDYNKLNNINLNYQAIDKYNIMLASDVCKEVGEYYYSLKSSYEDYLKIVCSCENSPSPFIQHSALGKIASFKLNYFYQQNEKEFLQELPYLTRRLSHLSLKEIIDNYCDKDIIENSLCKTFVKKGN